MTQGLPDRTPGPARPKLLDELRRACRARQLSGRTAEAYAGWARRYVLFHGKRHPRELHDGAVTAFLAHLANERAASASTQRQAASALLFLYREVLGLTVQAPQGVLRPGRPRRLPVVLARAEVAALLGEMRAPQRLVAGLLYGAGLRLLEGLRIRIKDVSLERGELVIRSGKGGHDRITMLPRVLAPELRRQLER
ncbi:MAG: phage integrase N-terminal SAM-like domain-containing protein, partial [Longimicrobiales bacterium]